MAGEAVTRRAPGPGWRVADALFLLMFAFSVVVQFNDPDPLAWAAMYGLAAAASALSLAGRLRPWFPALVGATALVWAVTLAPRVVGRVPFLDMFGAFEMKDVGVEESREMYGLLLIAAWMVVLFVRKRGSD
ncbi:MAG TPA: transmembrane 220 family protein [Gemmatimonadaceae bacterium]|nr:transmembrane 220 family protein [Gemmatimonadaceae bacterium]